MRLNLPIMKPARFLLFALGASSASACAWYSFCHCYDSDGVPDNKATETVCGSHYGALQLNQREYGRDTSYTECISAIGHGPYWNNCYWREDCKSAGATGTDSSCWCKLPIGYCY